MIGFDAFSKRRIGKDCQIRALDDYDWALIELLQVDAMRTAEELAEAVALSPSAIASRIRRLRDEGTIVADRAVMSERIGPFLTALVDIQLARHDRSSVDALISRLSARSEVQAIFEVAGMMDLALVLACRGMDGFNDFADEALADDPMVRRYETRLVKRRRKFTTAWPIDREARGG